MKKLDRLSDPKLDPNGLILNHRLSKMQTIEEWAAIQFKAIEKQFKLVNGSLSIEKTEKVGNTWAVYYKYNQSL